MTRPLDAVTFDLWNTLLVARPEDFRGRRIDLWLAALAEAQVDIDAGAIDACFERLLAVFDERWHANEQFTAIEAAAWAMDDLGLDPPPQLRAALLGAFVWTGDEVLPELAPGVREVLEVLAASDVRIGIVCDVGMTPSTSLRRFLAAHEVLDHFDHWSFSDEVGVYKPHAAIFEHALLGLGGIDPARAAHIGDLRRTDVAGARAMGMRAVRYSGVHDDAPAGGDDHPEGHEVVGHHAELLALLGFA